MVTDVEPLLTSQNSFVLQLLAICTIDPDDCYDRGELNGCIGFLEDFQLIHTNCDGGAYVAGTFRFFAGSKNAIQGKEYLWEGPAKKTTVSFISNGSDPYVNNIISLYEKMKKPQCLVPPRCLVHHSSLTLDSLRAWKSLYPGMREPLLTT